MILVVVALVLIGLKLAEVPPLAGWSWWWILSPLVLAFLWFEVFERLLRLDRKVDQEADHEKRRRERTRAGFGLAPDRRKRR